MSLYNSLFGVSSAAPLLLAALGLTHESFYRFRDCYLTEDGRIAVYTRGGGNNRECYDNGGECGASVHAADCVVSKQDANREHPNYLSDEDDDFDSTYATFYFSVPDTLPREALEAITPELKRDEVWTAFLSGLKGMAS